MKNIFNQYTTSEGVPFKLLNKKVYFPENKDIYDYVYVSENIPWTILSYQLYNSIEFWWVLSSLNQNAPFYAKKGTNIKFIPREILLDIIKYI